MSTTKPGQPATRSGAGPAATGSPGKFSDPARTAIEALIGIVAVMWVIELINTIDNNALDNDGIHARDAGRLWGILTAPFLHASFAHLISNTIPFIFMGVIIALRGVRELLLVTAIVIVVGGLGTWLIAPAHTSTIGASGVVFGYATAHAGPVQSQRARAGDGPGGGGDLGWSAAGQSRSPIRRLVAGARLRRLGRRACGLGAPPPLGAWGERWRWRRCRRWFGRRRCERPRSRPGQLAACLQSARPVGDESNVVRDYFGWTQWGARA
jgi:hypothetical protein